MRYVVTGGAGFIGSHIVEHLVNAGESVAVVDDFSTGNRENLSGVQNRISLIEGSVTDLDTCIKAFAGADYVLHQAAIPSVPRSVADPATTHEACATGTLNVLIAARDAGVRRVVYAGSSSAYGNTAVLPKQEGMKSRPLSPYAVAKLTGEHYCQAFTATYGLETVVLRYFNIFGPRQDPTSPYGAAIPKFVTAALSESGPTIFGDGEQTRDFTYVENAIYANLLACTAPSEASGKVFNVGCGDRISIRELWHLIRELTGCVAAAEYVEARAGEVRDSLADLTRACEFLSYEPRVNLREGLRRTIASLSPATTYSGRQVRADCASK